MSDTVSSGINSEKVTTWLETNVAGATAPFKFEFIAGGHSNLTFSVRDAKQNHYVLRRPPLSHGLASAHDMGREHRIISALHDSQVPVAPALGLCVDTEVNDAPFYVMLFVDGLIIRDNETARRDLTEATRLHASNSLIDTMAKIHQVDGIYLQSFLWFAAQDQQKRPEHKASEPEQHSFFYKS